MAICQNDLTVFLYETSYKEGDETFGRKLIHWNLIWFGMNCVFQYLDIDCINFSYFLIKRNLFYP
jgi:hypothetical protein